MFCRRHMHSSECCHYVNWCTFVFHTIHKLNVRHITAAILQNRRKYSTHFIGRLRGRVVGIVTQPFSRKISPKMSFFGHFKDCPPPFPDQMVDNIFHKRLQSSFSKMYPCMPRWYMYLQSAILINFLHAWMSMLHIPRVLPSSPSSLV